MRRVVLLAMVALGLSNTRPLLGAEIAVLDSAKTRNYFTVYGTCVLNSADPNAMGPDEYKRYWGGWVEVLNQMNLAYDIKDDAFITNPTANGLLRSKYKVLILSNNAGLATSQTDAIRQWVGSGGRLLATFGTGYAGVADSTGEALANKAGKNALQTLWGDPLSKFVTTGTFGTVATQDFPCSAPGSVEPVITQEAGPTGKICQFYIPGTNTCPPYYPSLRLVLGYGDLANMLVGRSENHPGSYAHFAFYNNLAVYDPNNVCTDTVYSKPLPSVVASPYKKGWAAYYPFAPEFIVGLEYDVVGHCDSDGNYPGGDPAPGLQASELTWEHNHWFGRTRELRALMKSTIDWLLKVQ